jgi:hypothetical protein
VINKEEKVIMYARVPSGCVGSGSLQEVHQEFKDGSTDRLQCAAVAENKGTRSKGNAVGDAVAGI